MKILRTLLPAVLAVLLAVAAPASALQDRHRLDELFRDLQSAPSDELAEAVEEEIWTIWLDHPGKEVLTLMHAGVQLLHEDEFSSALSIFDRIVKVAPDYAEGWNKRANAYYLMGDYDAAVSDIRHTLMLEPRHFGALAGLGLVYIAIDQPAAALRAFEGALAINPHMAGAREQVEKLRQTLGGAPL